MLQTLADLRNKIHHLESCTEVLFAPGMMSTEQMSCDPTIQFYICIRTSFHSQEDVPNTLDSATGAESRLGAGRTVLTQASSREQRLKPVLVSPSSQHLLMGESASDSVWHPGKSVGQRSL